MQASAKNYPDKIAFRDEKQSLSFAQLDQQSRSLACNISSALQGKTKQAIAVYLPKQVESVVAFLASAYSGNFYTPIDTSMPKARLANIFKTLKPTTIITNSNCVGELQEITTDQTIIDIAQTSSNERDDDLLNNIQSKVIDTDPLYVMFTSGSTGIPKGVVVSHRSVIDYIEWLSETFTFNEQTVLGNQAPFYFDNSILDIYCTLKNVCETVLIPEEKFLSPKRLCHYLDQTEINTIFWVPSALALVANSDVLVVNPPTKLQQVLFCGEVMPMKQLNVWRRAVPQAQYANLYGPTEITDVCAYYIVDREFKDDERLPIGTACRNTEILVLNDQDELISENETGELCVRGTCLASGYYGDLQKTSEVFVQNPLNKAYPEKIYRTGDLVRYNDYGELVYIGRIDSQIKHMGYRIELGEVETAAMAFHVVETCCALYDEEDQRIMLAVSPENIDKAELYKYLKTLLPRYMLPDLIETLPALPLNANSKIDRVKTIELMFVD